MHVSWGLPPPECCHGSTNAGWVTHMAATLLWHLKKNWLYGLNGTGSLFVRCYFWHPRMRSRGSRHLAVRFDSFRCRKRFIAERELWPRYFWQVPSLNYQGYSCGFNVCRLKNSVYSEDKNSTLYRETRIMYAHMWLKPLCTHFTSL